MVLAVQGYGAWSLIVGFGVQGFLALLGGFIVVQHSLWPSLFGDKKLRDFGIKVVAVNITNWAIENLDRFLVGKFWGVQALGLYAVAFNLSRAPMAILVSSFQTVAFASASRIQEDDERTRKGYLAILSALSLIMLPVFGVVSYEANTIIRVVYGETWSSAAPLLAAFAVTTPIYAFGAVTGPLLCARSAVREEFNAQFLVLAVLMIGLIVLRDAPLVQAVWIVPIAYTLRFLFLTKALQKVLPMPAHDIIRVLAGGVLLAVFGVMVDIVLRLVWAHSAEWTNLIPLIGAAVATLLLMNIVGKKLIGRELQALLDAGGVKSRVIRVLCGLLGLTSRKS